MTAAPTRTPPQGDQRDLPGRLANIVTEATAPAVMVAAQLLIAARQTGLGPGPALAWWALAALFGSVLPISFIVWGARVGRWATHHVPARRHRLLPMGVGILFMVVGVVVLTAVGAPRALTAAVAVVAATVTVLTMVTNWWKISAHTALAAGTAVALVVDTGPEWAIALALIPLTGWSRLRLRAHTLAQVIGGALVGIAVNGGLYLLLR